MRTGAAPTLGAQDYTPDDTLIAYQHKLFIDIAAQIAEDWRITAEQQSDTAEQQAAFADSPMHPAAALAVDAAHAAAEAAQHASDAYDAADAHFVLLSALRTEADSAWLDALNANDDAIRAQADTAAAADAAAAEADVAAAQQAFDTLTLASNPSVIRLDNAPRVVGQTGSSTVTGPPLIADLDQLHVAVSVRASVRTWASDAGGATYSPWSDWSNDRGDQWTDANGNGQYDAGKPYVDTNGNGIYDPPVGCPDRRCADSADQPHQPVPARPDPGSRVLPRWPR